MSLLGCITVTVTPVPAPFRNRRDVPCDPLAADDRLLSRANEPAAIGLRTHFGGEQALELGEIAVLRRGNERMQEAFLIVVADACSPSLRDMLACAGDELTRVGLFDAENLRNLPIRIVEGFAQHVGAAFRR